MSRTIALLFLLLPSIAPAAERLSLDADEYTLTITHETVRPPQVKFPSDEIAEDEYLPVKKKSKLQLHFSDDRKDVQILPGEISGELESADESKRVYQLKKGTFAGGRLDIVKTKAGLTGTVTKFGSGLPVTSSVRGELKPRNEDAEAKKKPERLETLSGVVIRKEWTKSPESWNAGGSEYYVLKVADDALPAEKRTAREGVILRPSKAVPFEQFEKLVGKTVTCRGKFVAGKPDVPDENNFEQRPSLPELPGGKPVHEIRGSGFRVTSIERGKEE